MQMRLLLLLMLQLLLRDQDGGFLVIWFLLFLLLDGHFVTQVDEGAFGSHSHARGFRFTRFALHERGALDLDVLVVGMVSSSSGGGQSGAQGLMRGGVGVG